MAFENINVASLKNALITCKDSIKFSETNEILENISSNNIWDAKAKNNLKKALSILKNERFKKLENLLNKYLDVTNDLEKYKQIQSENEELLAKYNYLGTQLYKNETYKEYTINFMGKKFLQNKNKTVIDYNVQNQMNAINRTINENEEKLKNLEIKIKNSI